MRRRELQSITLKLTELKEYEQIRAERLAAEKAKLADQEPGSSKVTESIATSADCKSADEIKERIGMAM